MAERLELFRSVTLKPSDCFCMSVFFGFFLFFLLTHLASLLLLSVCQDQSYKYRKNKQELQLQSNMGIKKRALGIFERCLNSTLALNHGNDKEKKERESEANHTTQFAGPRTRSILVFCVRSLLLCSLFLFHCVSFFLTLFSFSLLLSNYRFLSSPISS